MTAVIIIGIIIFILFAVAGKNNTTPAPLLPPTYKKQKTSEELKAEMVQSILKISKSR